MSWTLFALVAVPVFIVMMRLDRLGKQVEAVCHLIQLEIAENNPDRKAPQIELPDNGNLTSTG